MAPVWRVLLLGFGLLLSTGSPAQTRNGFDLSETLIPASDILPGGPPRDGIPAIDAPEFVAASQADFLQDDDLVLGLAIGGDARAYPLRILNWHEVVNDRFGDRPVAITYCPLCGTGVAFAAQVGGRALRFGVSGLLYQSDVLLYDRQTESLWSQLLGQSVSGPMKGERLTTLPLTQTSWRDWRRSHPRSRVLSTSTGQIRPYDRDPYAGYADRPETYFPVAFRAAGLHPKEQVLGLTLAGQDKAWPFVELARAARMRSADAAGDVLLTDTLAGQPVHIRFNAEARRATAHDASGRQLPGVIAYWFAWSAFHPQTGVYRASDAR